MSQVKLQIERMKSAFKEAQETIDRFSDIKLFTQRTNQLHSVEKSIQLLKKKDTPIPDDLRKLKMELIDALDEYKTLEQFKKLVLDLSKEFIAQNKSKRKSRVKKSSQNNDAKAIQGNLFKDDKNSLI